MLTPPCLTPLFHSPPLGIALQRGPHPCNTLSCFGRVSIFLHVKSVQFESSESKQFKHLGGKKKIQHVRESCQQDPPGCNKVVASPYFACSSHHPDPASLLLLAVLGRTVSQVRSFKKMINKRMIQLCLSYLLSSGAARYN